MEEGKALINIGELSKPATVLIEKISEAVGGVFRPYQIRRVAEAEANAEKIKAVSQIEVTDLQRRAMHRFLEEEAKKQANIENIAAKALPDVAENSSPEKIEDDWLTHFFDKCRLISDDEMQNLWAKVLAGEANSPGKFSKRTIASLASLDKQDALLFQQLCAFVWDIGGPVPLIFEDENDGIPAQYSKVGINFETLKHLDEIGLITHEANSGFHVRGREEASREIEIFYYGSIVTIIVEGASKRLDIGTVLLSKVGEDLVQICDSKPEAGFMNYAIEKWESFGHKVTVTK